MGMENSWVPATPLKPPLRRPSPGEDDQQKPDGSTEEAEAGNMLACSDTHDFVTIDSEKMLVVDLDEMKWVENDANCCSISASSQYELLSKTVPHFVPVTPDKRTNVELKQVVQVQSSPAGEQGDEEGHEEKCRTVSIRTDENSLQQEDCALVSGSSCASLLTPTKCNHSSDKEIIVNVSETTQVKQTRRKHRPKVISEGKPRTSKPVTQRAADSKENLTKRKYVRRNAVNKPLESPLELGTPNLVIPKVSGSKENSKGKRKYVRKCAVKTTETPVEETGVLTDVEAPHRSRKTCRRSLKFDNEGKQIDESSSCKYLSNISGSLAPDLTTGSDQSHSVLQHGNESEAMFDQRQASILHDPKNCKYLPQCQVSNLETPVGYSSSQLKVQNNRHKDEGGMGEISSSSSKDLICSNATVSTERKQARGSKRKLCHYTKQDDIRSSDLIEEFYNSIYAYQMPPPVEYVPRIHKRQKIDKVQHFGPSSTYSNVRPQTHSCLIPRILGGSANFNKFQPFECTLGSWSNQSNMQSKYFPKQPPVITDLQRVENSHRRYRSLGAQVGKMNATAARKKQTLSDMYGAEQHQELALFCHFHPGAPSEINSGQNLYTDAMVEEMKMLDINREGKISLYEEHNERVLHSMQNQGHNALVVYGRDGSVVPYEGFLDPVKKRRRHAKVDLDGETIRVWKLLMENFNSEGVDGSDEARSKWWEEERRVFSGRADSFISRMHLIQGDRGFSQWKGSVLDSVIGVFLTQNVSDHLSSSAFMSLAARFPLKSRSLHESSIDDGTSLVVNEPQINLWKAEDSVTWSEQSSDQPNCKRSCMTVCETEQAEENFLTSSESSGSNTAGITSMHECQCSTSCNSSQKIVELEDRRSTTKISTIVDACSLGEEKLADAAISSQTSILSEHSLNSSRPLSIEDRMPCLKSNCGIDLSSKEMSVNEPVSSMKVIQIIETTEQMTDSKNASGDNSSDEKTAGTCSKSEEKQVNQRENNDSADCPRNLSRDSPSDSSHQLQKTLNSGVTEVECFDICRQGSQFAYVYKKRGIDDTNEHAGTLDSASQTTILNTTNVQATRHSRELSNVNQSDQDLIFQSQGRLTDVPYSVESEASVSNQKLQQTLQNSLIDTTLDVMSRTEEPDRNKHDHSLHNKLNSSKADTLKPNRKQVKKEKKDDVNWDNIRKQAEARGRRERTTNTRDSLDWEAVRCADVGEIAYTIRERGMNNRLAERIKDFLNRLVKDHGSTDLEWLRDAPPDQVKEYLLSVRGLGLKSVECVRLLTLHQLAFPVDTNVGRIAVRLGWVPLQPLPESLQLHLLELYPILESIQKYLWPRLCKLDQRTLYELHYQMITFGKVFCTKSKPNCNACPMRGECRHFASAFASARLALPAPEEKRLVIATEREADINQAVVPDQQPLALTQASNPTEENQQSINQFNVKCEVSNIEPIIEEPATPEPECPQTSEKDIEDALCEDPDEIPTIKLNIEAFNKNLQNYMQENMEIQESSMSKALVVVSPEAASIPMPKLKNISRLRTEHQVYELPDSHPLLEKLKLERRELDDPCLYLLAIWTPGETANSIELPHAQCNSQEDGKLCGEKECFSCNSVREANSKVVRGTLLIPCRTAMRGSFPLNGTYFQVNEVFADHDSSLNPIDVPRTWLWNLSRRTVYFGTSIPTIFKGLSTEEIQCCFWRGYVCVRGFDRKTRAPRPLIARLHCPASKVTAIKGKTTKPDDKYDRPPIRNVYQRKRVRGGGA